MRKLKKILLLIIIPCLLMSSFIYVHALFTSVAGWYKLGEHSEWIFSFDVDSCSIATNNSTKTFFIPTHSALEITSFESYTPSDLIISSDSQPQCWTGLDTKCIEWDFTWISSPSGYDCGSNNVDKCYDWSCETACWMDDTCSFVDEWGWSSCFVAGTPITLADGSQKVIEDVSVWDTLVGMWNQINTVQKLVKKVYTRNLYSINGSDYFVTDNHLFLTAEWWKSFDAEMGILDHPGMIVWTLEIGDTLFTEDGPIQIVSLASRTSSEYVYSFEADGNHTYYSHWYLVHNSSIIDG